MAVFVVAHGAWSGGWSWKKMRPLLRSAGHEIFTPTYTGCGEREHLTHRGINLSTHIDDVVKVLEFENLTDVVLVGHSFGGLVATGIADAAPDRIARVIYLDAFVPQHGESLMDLVSAYGREQIDTACRALDGWRVPPMDLPPDTPDADRAWALARRRPHPLAAFEEPVRLSGRPLPRSDYIYCTRADTANVFARFARAARADATWRYAEIDASHNPHISAPQALLELLQRFVDD